MTLARGDHLSRYEITAVLGRGAMGMVYLAHDPHIERPVALKTLSPDPGSPDRGAEIEARFIKEAKIAGRLQHPNIVTIYDVGRDKDVAFIAMEYVDGEPLTNWIPRESFTLPQRVDVTRQVARALEHAHDRGVIHRDVKPGNILLTSGRLVKVADFGIGKLLISGTPDLTQTGVLVGSPAYMSPEQIKGERLDGRSDFFSLGVVFYQLLTGQRPFPGEAITTLVYQILHTEPRDPRELRRDLPASSREVFAKLLAKSPADRPANASEFILEIEKFESDRTLVLTDLKKIAESGAPPPAPTRPAIPEPPAAVIPRPTPPVEPAKPEPTLPAAVPRPTPAAKSSPPEPTVPPPSQPPAKPTVRPPEPPSPSPPPVQPTPSEVQPSMRETVPAVRPESSLHPTVRYESERVPSVTLATPARRSRLPLIFAIAALAVLATILVLSRSDSKVREEPKIAAAPASREATAVPAVPTGPSSTPTARTLLGAISPALPKPTPPPPAPTVALRRTATLFAPSPTVPPPATRAIPPKEAPVQVAVRRSPTTPRTSRPTPIGVAQVVPTPTAVAIAEAPLPTAPPTSAPIAEQPPSSAPGSVPRSRPAASEGGSNADRLNAMIEQGRVLFKTGRYHECAALLGDLQDECKKKENEYVCLGLRAGASFYRGAAFAEMGNEIEARAQFWIFLALKPNTVLSPREYSYKVIHAFDLARRMR